MTATEVEALRERLVTAFEKIPHHRRLYSDEVVGDLLPVFLEAVERTS